jgi:hypothetical protein
MPNETNNSLVNLGDISKPADTLIKKVSKAVGGIFEPYQIKRIAKAEAEAAIIKVQAEIQITDLHRRAIHRFIDEEAQKQKNMEDITSQAIPHLEEKTDAAQMDDDWVTNFFDKSRIVSNKEMQGLWARVLAGEANKPGTYSKRTVNYLGDLDKVDADSFTRLCGFGWQVDSIVPLIFDFQAEIYNKKQIDFGVLSHLESIGLIQFNSLSAFKQIELPRKFHVSYYGRLLLLEMPKDTGNQLQLGHVLLTRVGQELAPICGSTPVEGFMDYVKEKWKAHLPAPVTEQGDPGDAPQAARP